MSGDLDDDAPGFEDVLAAAARAEIALTHGPIPARVLAYDPATQRATVQAVVASADPMGVPVPAPVRQGVPVAWPVWSGGSITWPLSVGSWVMLVPQDADVSAWAQAGTTGQPPPSGRSCSMTDVIALPLCGLPASAPLPATAYSALGPVVAGAHVFLVSSTAADFVALASKVLTELGNIKAHLDTLTFGPGTFTTPSGPVTGTSGPPITPMPTPGSVASTKIHGE